MRTDVPEFDREIGILCWMTDEDGVPGSVKERPEDFIVEEILPDGSVLSLESPRLPRTGYEGLFTHFVLVKRGIGNFDAIWLLSSLLKVPFGYFFYSGNKDKDALTVQRVAVFGVPPEKLLSLELPSNIRIYDPVRELRRIHIGEHKGNRFRIRIREIPSELVERALRILQDIRQLGFLPNFFGYQRFGLARPISHYVGKLLLLRKYREALLVFLAAPSLGDGPKAIEAKEAVLNGDFRLALKKYPKREFLFERIALRYLIRKNDPKVAFKRLPAFLLRIFVEAYQAYIFNRLLSAVLLEHPDDFLAGRFKRLPILGISTKTRDSIISYLLRRILNEEGVSLKLLKNSEFPPLTFRGTIRNSQLRPTFHQIEPRRGQLFISFSLGKGEYATVILREILKHHTLKGLLCRIIKEDPERVTLNLKRLEEFKKVISEFLA